MGERRAGGTRRTWGNEGNALQTPQNTGRGYAEPKDKIRNYLSDRGGKDRLNMGTCRLRTAIGTERAQGGSNPPVSTKPDERGAGMHRMEYGQCI